MRKRAFITPTVIFLLILLTMVLGTMVEGVTSLVGLMRSRSSGQKLINASELGVKLAEDWLLSSIDAGYIPRGNPGAPGSLLEKIEAVRPDGGRAEYTGGLGLELYIADTDYTSELFGRSGSTIPRIPEDIMEDGVSRRCYFLRSTANSPEGGFRLVSEEVLAVSFDNLGKMTGVSRLFYRSSSSSE
jgi:hypothetical protein